MNAGEQAAELESLRNIARAALNEFDATGVSDGDTQAEILEQALLTVDADLVILTDAASLGEQTIDGMVFVRLRRRIKLALALANRPRRRVGGPCVAPLEAADVRRRARAGAPESDGVAVSRSKGARAIMLQALGSLETDDLQTALSIVISGLHAEAEMLQMGENLGPHSEMLEYAHTNRLKALEEFFDEYVTVSWRTPLVQAKQEAAE